MKQLVLLAALIVWSAYEGSEGAAAPEDLEPTDSEATQVQSSVVTSTPNVIVFLADDLGIGDIGRYGQTKIRTPNIDRLAFEGKRFTRHYSGNTVCAPSRCSLLTGKHQGHCYVRSNAQAAGRSANDPANNYWTGNTPLSAGEVTIAEMLKQKNYATAAIGKWGLGYEGSSGDPLTQGFDLFYGYLDQTHAHNHYPKFLWRDYVEEELPDNDWQNGTGQSYAQDKFTQVALDFIDQNQAKPFFLYLPWVIPHAGLQVPDSALAEYAGTFPETPYTNPTGGTYFPQAQPRAAYAAMVSEMDRGVGQVMAKLKELAIDDNTIVMFTADNGPAPDGTGGSDGTFFNSSAGLSGRKSTLLEGGIRAPLIVRWPGKIAANTSSSHLSAGYDLMATIAGLTGTTVPAGGDGISFKPTLLGTTGQKARSSLYWEFRGSGGWQAVRKGNWKAIRKDMLKASNPNKLRIYLYNIVNDPKELTDVAASQATVVNDMKNIMTAAHVPSTLFPMPPID